MHAATAASPFPSRVLGRKLLPHPLERPGSLPQSCWAKANSIQRGASMQPRGRTRLPPTPPL